MMTDGGTPTSDGTELDSPTVDGTELAATLRQVEEVRQRARADVHPAWFPMLLFGLIGLASVPVGLIGGGPGTGLFWIVAGPAGGYATSRYYQRRAISIGAGVRGGVHVALGVAIFLAACTSGWLTESAAPPMVAVAIGYLGFARLERSWPVAGVSAGLGAAAVLVALTDPPHADVLLSLVFGVAFTVTGLLLRRRDRG